MKKSPYRFIVNALGEMVLGDDFLGGSVSVADVEEATFTQAELAQWRGKAAYANRRESPLGSKLQRAIVVELDVQARERLSEDELAIYTQVTFLQQVNNDRFRVYGGITGKRKWIVLVAEFKAFTEKKALWREIRKAAKALRAKWYLMYKQPHLHCYWPPRRSRGERIVDKDLPTVRSGISGELHPWAFGPNHGKMEEQVELSWNIKHMHSLTPLKALIEKISKATGPLWKQAGVSVI